MKEYIAALGLFLGACVAPQIEPSSDYTALEFKCEESDKIRSVSSLKQFVEENDESDFGPGEMFKPVPGFPNEESYQTTKISFSGQTYDVSTFFHKGYNVWISGDDFNGEDVKIKLLLRPGQQGKGVIKESSLTNICDTKFIIYALDTVADVGNNFEE